MSLKSQLTAASERKGFVLHSSWGTPWNTCSREAIEYYLRTTLQLSLLFGWVTKLPVVKISGIDEAVRVPIISLILAYIFSTLGDA